MTTSIKIKTNGQKNHRIIKDTQDIHYNNHPCGSYDRIWTNDVKIVERIKEKKYKLRTKKKLIK